MNTQIQKRRQIKLAKKVTRLITVVLVCLLPNFIWEIVTLFVRGQVSSETIRMVSVGTFLGVLSNSCVNPFIYMSFMDFEMKLKKTLGWTRKRAIISPTLELHGTHRQLPNSNNTALVAYQKQQQ